MIKENNTILTACLTVILTSAAIILLKWLVSRKKRNPKPARVFITENTDDCERKLRTYIEHCPYSLKFLGLDCEWVNEKGVLSHPVALLQIATPLNDCFLIRLCKMTGKLPPCLKEILQDRNVLKFGVGILDDAKKLSDTYGVVITGCVDLRHLVLRCQPITEAIDSSKWHGKMSLSALAYKFLGVQMDKTWQIQCSNWEAEELTERQISYAANDAIVAVHLFMTLVQMKRTEKDSKETEQTESIDTCKDSKAIPEPKKAHQANSAKPLEVKEHYFSRTLNLEKYETHWLKGYVDSAKDLISDDKFCQVGFSLCKGISDMGFKLKSKPQKRKEENGGSLSGHKQKPYRRGFTERKTPLYSNCQLVAPDGAVLSTIERRKAAWYLEKGIGELVSEDPYTVRLKFEPSGRPQEEDNYYLKFKENICVVCGQGDSYLRKHIVPHEYRRHFPLCMKDHHSHDIVLMCLECHRVSTYYDVQMRQRMAQDYDTPLGKKEIAKLIQDPVLVKVRSAAKALDHAANKIPVERLQVLLEILQDYYSTTNITPDMIKEASLIDIHKENANFKSHGEVVVMKVKEKGKLLEFEKMWRSHFVDTMSPKHLPEFWSVDHRFEKMKAALDQLEKDGE